MAEILVQESLDGDVRRRLEVRDPALEREGAKPFPVCPDPLGVLVERPLPDRERDVLGRLDINEPRRARAVRDDVIGVEDL